MRGVRHQPSAPPPARAISSGSSRTSTSPSWRPPSSTTRWWASPARNPVGAAPVAILQPRQPAQAQQLGQLLPLEDALELRFLIEVVVVRRGLEPAERDRPLHRRGVGGDRLPGQREVEVRHGAQRLLSLAVFRPDERVAAASISGSASSPGPSSRHATVSPVSSLRGRWGTGATQPWDSSLGRRGLARRASGRRRRSARRGPSRRALRRRRRRGRCRAGSVVSPYLCPIFHPPELQ